MRRAQSSVYYALFHCLARNAADMLIGGEGADRSDKAWCQVYRALDHNTMFKRCDDKLIRRFPNTFQDFGYWFKSFQIKRHQADYDPSYDPDLTTIREDLDLAKTLLEDFAVESEKDRRAFAAYLVVNQRNDKQVRLAVPDGAAAVLQQPQDATDAPK